MRGKQAKRLRKEAREQTVGMPERAYRKEKHKSKSVLVGGFPRRRRMWLNTNQLRLSELCTRYVYKVKKEQYRARNKAV